MKRAWSVAEGPSINNKQQLSCVWPSVSRGTRSQAQHLRGVCCSFRLWSCLFQWLIKVWMCKYTQGCVSVFTAHGSTVLYSEAGWKQKGRIKSGGGTRKKGAASTLQNCRELPQIPAAQDWLGVSGECQPSVVLMEVGQRELEEWEVHV